MSRDVTIGRAAFEIREAEAHLRRALVLELTDALNHRVAYEVSDKPLEMYEMVQEVARIGSVPAYTLYDSFDWARDLKRTLDEHKVEMGRVYAAPRDLLVKHGWAAIAFGRVTYDVPDDLLWSNSCGATQPQNKETVANE